MRNWTKTAIFAATATSAAASIACEAAARQQASPAPLSEQDVRTRGVLILRPTATAQPPATPVQPPADPVVIAVAQPAVAQPTVVKPAPMIAPVIRDCPRPFAHADLHLGDAAGFDGKLKSRLRSRRQSVVVDLATPFVVGSAAPVALSPWLNAVKTSGGLVRVDSYCQASRGMFGNFFKKLFAAGGDDVRPYKAADGYDAVLHADGLDQRVTQVEFALRSAK